LPKDASEEVGFVFDFSRFPEAEDGETLTGTPTMTTPGGITASGSPVVLTAAVDGVPIGQGVRQRYTGGTAGTDYAVECLGTFTGGNLRVVKGVISVE
jgi:hypothetical protein